MGKAQEVSEIGDKEMRELKAYLESHVFRKLVRHEDREDAIQDALVRVWKKRDRIDPEKLMAYGMLSANNRCRDYYRKGCNRFECQMYLTELGDPIADLTQSTEFESAALDRLQLEIVISKIAELDDSKRIPLMLWLKGHTEKEIAEVVGLPSGTVKSRMNRCRAILMRQFVG